MTKLHLNIYKNEKDENGKRIIDKTYTTESSDMLYGPIEDIVSIIDLQNIDNDVEMAKAIMVALKQVKPILTDVFFGLTEDELRRTSTNELVVVTVAIIMQTIEGILSDDTIKNVMGGRLK